MLKKLLKTAQKRLNVWKNPTLLTKIFRYYPPYLGAGVVVETIDFTHHHIRVSMPLTKLNQNLVGTQFGGSLYSMTDPFLMILLLNALGSNYVVWDKKASIDFIKAGTGKVTANFYLSNAEIMTIQELAKDGKAVFREYQVEILDELGEVVAKVDKTLYIRLREFSKSKNQSVRV